MADIPYGYCHCGCGQLTKLSPMNWAKGGYVKGQPYKYVTGHNRRCHGDVPEYIVDPITGCWNCQHAINTKGYGYAKVKQNGRYVGVMRHRLVYERLVGPVPREMALDHLCRNPQCVNPAHLRVVTDQVNCQAGNQATLLPDQVLWMREKRAENPTFWTFAELGAEFGVTDGTAHAAVSGRTWSNI